MALNSQALKDLLKFEQPLDPASTVAPTPDFAPSALIDNPNIEVKPGDGVNPVLTALSKAKDVTTDTIRSLFDEGDVQGGINKFRGSDALSKINLALSNIANIGGGAEGLVDQAQGNILAKSRARTTTTPTQSATTSTVGNVGLTGPGLTSDQFIGTNGNVGLKKESPISDREPVLGLGISNILALEQLEEQRQTNAARNLIARGQLDVSRGQLEVNREGNVIDSLKARTAATLAGQKPLKIETIDEGGNKVQVITNPDRSITRRSIGFTDQGEGTQVMTNQIAGHYLAEAIRNGGDIAQIKAELSGVSGSVSTISLFSALSEESKKEFSRRIEGMTRANQGGSVTPIEWLNNDLEKSPIPRFETPEQKRERLAEEAIRSTTGSVDANKKAASLFNTRGNK